MSNRSSKDIFTKEANDTLKRVLISPEFRNRMMELMTGTKPKNGKASLEWSMSDMAYIALEKEYNDKLAKYITDLRHEMKDRLSESKKDRAKDRYRTIIPDEKFNEYWEEKNVLDADLDKYRRMSYLYTDDKRRMVNDYIYSAESVVQNMYGSPLPVKKYHIEDYKALVELYKKHRSQYDLAYPSFPEEHLY
jgi:hypothetical protein